MAEQGRESKDLLTRLADAGEDAIQRLADVPGGRRMVDAVGGLRDRIDELQHRMRRVDELEKRVGDLEQKLAAAETKKTPRKSPGTRRAAAAPRTPTQKS